MFRMVVLLLLVGLLVSPPLLAQDELETEPTPGPTLTSVLARGQINCGVNEDVFGFGFLNPNTGAISGLSADLCRALAVAVFGDRAGVDLQLQPLGAGYDQLLAGGQDVLLAYELEYSLSTPAEVAFAPAYFYEGQSIMVAADSGLETWADLDGRTICATTAPRVEQNIRQALDSRGLNYDLLLFDSSINMTDSLISGRCDAQTLDRTLLEILRQSTANPSAYTVWQEPFTRRVIRPAYRYADQQWAEIVNWTLWGLLEAERLGISSETINTLAQREGESNEDYSSRVAPETTSLLNNEAITRFGLAPDFMVAVVQQVGHYGEIYDRHMGPQSELPMERLWNRIWTDGGLLNAPPWH